VSIVNAGQLLVMSKLFVFHLKLKFLGLTTLEYIRRQEKQKKQSKVIVSKIGIIGQ